MIVILIIVILMIVIIIIIAIMIVTMIIVIVITTVVITSLPPDVLVRACGHGALCGGGAAQRSLGTPPRDILDKKFENQFRKM